MKFNTLMVIKAAVCLVLGVPMLIKPDLIYTIFGLNLEPGGAFAAREYGASLLGALMITWFARNTPESETRWAIALGYCVYDLFGFVASLVGVLNGIINPLGWLVVVLYLFFAVTFGYFTVRSPRTVMQAKTA